MAKLNTAQKNIKELQAVATGEVELEFLAECFKAWEGYSDMMYSYPHWQLRKLEEKYGTTCHQIKQMYHLELKRMYG